MLQEGYIALQSEGHPIEFRKVELLNLAGCTDPKASNYKSYFVKSDNARCRYPGGRDSPADAAPSHRTAEEILREMEASRTVDATRDPRAILSSYSRMPTPASLEASRAEIARIESRMVETQRQIDAGQASQAALVELQRQYSAEKVRYEQLIASREPATTGVTGPASRRGHAGFGREGDRPREGSDLGARTEGDRGKAVERRPRTAPTPGRAGRAPAEGREPAEVIGRVAASAPTLHLAHDVAAAGPRTGTMRRHRALVTSILREVAGRRCYTPPVPYGVVGQAPASPVRDSRRHRCRRDGRGLQGARHPPWPHRRHQGAARRRSRQTRTAATASNRKPGPPLR